MLTDLQADGATIAWLLSFAFSGGTTRIATLSHDISYSGNTYEGVGGYITFSPIQETAIVDAASVRVQLSGVDDSVITELLAENYIGREASIILVHLSGGGSIVSDPLEFGPWLMNGAWEIEEARERDAGTVTIRTTLMSAVAQLNRVRGIQMNPTSHQQHFSGDTIMEKVAMVATRRIYWGNPMPNVAGGGSGSAPRNPEGGDRPPKGSTEA